MKRVCEPDESNCRFENVDVRMVSTCTQIGCGEAFADNFDLTLPVLVNTKVLNVGDELRVCWKANEISKTGKGANITWASQARAKIGKKQLKHSQ